MKKLSLALPHIVAVFVFMILGAVYFAPQFDGYGLNQSDTRQYAGMSKEISDFRQLEKDEPLWTNSAFSGMPAYQISMTTPNMMITVENFVIFKIFKPPFGYLFLAMISFYVLLLCFGVNPWLSIVGAIAFGFSSIHILYLAGGHNTKVHAIALMPGIIGGLIYAYRKNFRIGGLLLCIFICLHLSANHIQETYYLLFLIAAIIIIEFYIFYKEHRLSAYFKISAFLLLSSMIGVAPTLSNLLLTNEYAKYTNRGTSDLTVSSSSSSDNSESKGLDRNYIKEYSMGYGEVWSVAIPNVKGGSSSKRLGDFKEKLNDVKSEYREDVANFPAYWGEQSGSGGAFYFGATIFLLFVLGMVFIKDKIKWAFLAASALAFILSWKYSSILDLFIDYVPLFNKFRDTKMILVLVQISFPLLALLFLNELLNKQLDQKKLLYTMGATIGVFLLIYLLPSLWFDFFNNDEITYFDKQASLYPQALQQINLFRAEIEQVRMAILKADVLRSIFFMILVAGAIILFTRKKMAKQYFILCLGGLILVDIWMVDKRYLDNDLDGHYWIKSKAKSVPFRPGVADLQILNWEMTGNNVLKEKVNLNLAQLQTTKGQDAEIAKVNLAFTMLNFETDYRVLSLDNPFANAATSYYHKSLGGYHAAKLKRYVELIDFRLNKECQALANAISGNNDSLLDFTLKTQLPALNMLNTKYIIFNPDTTPVKNPYANGAAWIVKNIKIVKDANEEIKALDSIDTKHTAIIEKSFVNILPRNYKYDSLAFIHLKLYRPNHLIYETNAANEQVGIFSEIYYKDGWNAYIDGKPSSYFRANYVLRAITIPAGKHSIEFKFEPATYYLSKKLSYAGSFLIIFFTLGVIVFEIRNRKSKLI
jgi:hypothetical protein